MSQGFRLFARSTLVIAGLGACLAVSGCKLIANEASSAAGEGGVDVFFDDPSFDADAVARQIWDDRVLPYISGLAGEFDDVTAALDSGADVAGEQFGHRVADEGSPWVISTRIKGLVVSGKLDTRAATIDIDTNGDEAADVVLQIGPVVRGTSIRDSLDFISFGDFTNQIQYAKFGKALNAIVIAGDLAAVDKENVIGMSVDALGVFTEDGKSDLPIVTPVQITISEPGS